MSGSGLESYGAPFFVDAAGGVATESADVPLQPGRWRLFPSRGELAFVLREESDDAMPSPLPRSAIGGDFASVTPADLAMFLSQTRRTGVLVTRAHGVGRTLSFREGKLAWAASSEPSEGLGPICVRYGLVEAAALEPFVGREDDPDGRRLGARLVQAKVLGGHELWRAVRLQVSEIFWALLIKNAGAFVLVDAPDDPSFASHLKLDTQALLLEGFRRVDEMSHFRRRLPNPQVRPRRAAPPPPDASAEEKLVHHLADGSQTLVEIGIRSRYGEFEATKLVHRLLETGALQVDGSAHELTPGPREAELPAMLAAHNAVLAQVFVAARDAGMDGPYRISVDAFLQAEQKPSGPADLALSPDGTLAAKTMLPAVASEGSMGDQLRALVSAVTAFALFQAREILEGAVVEELEAKARAVLGED